MKTLIKIFIGVVVCAFFAFGIKDNVPKVKGVSIWADTTPNSSRKPSPNSPSAYQRIGIIKADSVFGVPVRDTNFIPGFPGAIILWQNPGVDTAQWQWDGRRWRKSSSSGDSTAVTNKGTGQNPLYVGVGATRDTLIGKRIRGVNISISTDSDSSIVIEDTASGGSVDLDSVRRATEFVVYSVGGSDSAVIKGADTVRSGALISTDKKKLDRVFVANDVAEMRTISTVGTNVGVIRLQSNTNPRINGDFYYDAADVTTADDGAMVIVNGTKRFKRNWQNFGWIHVDWFGAIPGDATSDSAAIQSAINTAVRDSIPIVKFAAGNYIAKNNVVYKDANADGEYEFVTLSLVGAASFATNTTATTIFVQGVEDFGIAIQLGRNCNIIGIGGSGLAPIPPGSGIAAVVEASEATWEGTCRNNRYSPYAFFIVDPFHASVSAGDRYPNATAYYTNTGTGGSSMITFDRCAVTRFLVGVMVSPNGYTLNGDNVVYSNGSGSFLKTFWAAGQTQSRANMIGPNVYLTNTFQQIMDSRTYGEQNGTLPRALSMSVAGGCKYILNTNSGFQGVDFSACNFESLWSIGFSGSQPISFGNGTEVHLDYSGVTFMAPLMHQGAQLIFKEGSTLQYTDQANLGFAFQTTNLTFDNAYLNGGMPINSSSTGKTQFFGTRMPNQQPSSDAGITEGGPFNGPSPSQSAFGLNGAINVSVSGTATNWANITFKNTYSKLDLIESDTIVIDTTTHTGYFVTSNSEYYLAGDGLYTQTNLEWSNDLFSTAPGFIGNVTSVTGDTVRLRRLPWGLPANRIVSIYLVHTPLYVRNTWGDLVNGSDTIRSVQYNGSSFAVGNFIYGIGLPEGTRVKYVDLVGGKIALTVPATATGTFVELFDAKPFFQARSSSPTGSGLTNVVVFKGDEIINNGQLAANDSIASWVCTLGGVNDGSPAAVWRPVYNELKSGNASISSTQVGYGSPGNTLTSEAAFTYNATTNAMLVDSVRSLSLRATQNMYMPLIDSLTALSLKGNLRFDTSSNEIYYRDNYGWQPITTVASVFSGRSNVRVAAGVVRPTLVGSGAGATLTWAFLTAATNHDSLLFTGVYPYNSHLTFTYPNMSQVVTFIITPDETLASRGITCGCSVEVDSALCNIYIRRDNGGFLRGQGTSTWAQNGMSGWTINYNTSTGVLSVQYPAISGTTSLWVENAWAFYAGSNLYTLQRQLSGLGSDWAAWKLVDNGGNAVTGNPTTSDIIQLHGPVDLFAQVNPGIVGGDLLSQAVFTSNTNFWVMAIFKL